MRFQFLFLILLVGFQLKAQEDISNEKIIFISPVYDLQFPFGDMKTDFGINSTLGLDLSIINANNVYVPIFLFSFW